MLIINGKEIQIDNMKYNTGAFFGQNFIPTWNSHFKSNINVTSISIANDLNGTSHSINIINDRDGLDFVGSSSDYAEGYNFGDNGNKKNHKR